MRPHLFALAAALVVCAPALAANHDTVVPPIGAGRFKVACSNIEQDPALIAKFGTAPIDFWEGRPANGQLRYISQILAAPGTALKFDAPVPDVRDLYPQFAGDTVTHVAIVCHPTPASNSDPDYVLPGTGDKVPRMQPAGAAPKLLGSDEYYRTLGYAGGGANTTVALPLIVFSHGLGGSPISPGYIGAMVDLASQGFVVGAVFHGDARFSRIRIEDFGDVAYLLRDFDLVVEMELMRPLSLKTMTDVLLAHPYFSAAIDAQRIGGFGASMGGQAMANLLGARLSTSIGLSCHETVRDPRIKAAVGLVPYAGQTFLPSFCRGQNGAVDVRRPYLAISGTADTTAPIKMMEQAANLFSDSRYVVALEGVKHEYLPEYRGDVMTWAVTFLRAYLGADLYASESVPNTTAPYPMAQLIRMGSVAGGPADSLRVDVHVAGEPTNDPVAVEFYNDTLGHYFVTAYPGEATGIDAGAAGPGWQRTGHAFRVSHQSFGFIYDPIPSVPVCRFYGRPAGGPNSHFYTANAGECAFVKIAGGWYYEGIAFWVIPPNPDFSCPLGMLSVLRAYNNGFPRNDSNHRYTTSNSTLAEMQRNGWKAEGTVMCASP
jgi:hypothetical protein